jgi:MFS family permease
VATPSDPRPPSFLRRIPIDVEPLRVSHDFRLIWSGLFISELGYQFTLVAIFVQVYALTGSAAAVGLTGLFSFLALVLGSVISGAVVDAYDRRTLLLIAQVGFALGSGILLLGALAGRPPVWLIYLATSIQAMVSTIDGPTRQAMTPRLVGVELMPSAAALNQVVWNGVGLLGPALGGIVIVHLGLQWAYGVDLVTYGVMFVVVLMIAPMPPGSDEGPPVSTGWTAVREGFSFVRASRLLQSTFTIDLFAMIFGLPRALFPVLAATRFHNPEVISLLFSAPAAGAVLAATTSGWVHQVQRQGVAVIVAVILWGAAIVGFGLAGDNLLLSLVLLAFAGASDVISAIFRNTILQLAAPEELRGRLSAIHILVVTGGPRLGDLEAGLVAQWFSPTVSIVSGGLLCIVGAGAVAVGYPQLRRYRHAPAEGGASEAGRAPAEP